MAPRSESSASTVREEQLLRIIAGIDKDYMGEITMSKGYTVGLLEQEPQLDKNKTVKEIVEEGRTEVVSLLHDYEAVSNKLGRKYFTRGDGKVAGETEPAPGKNRSGQRMGVGK